MPKIPSVLLFLGIATLAVGAPCLASAPEKTIENLNKAIEGETNANYRYQLFAAKADAEGHPEAAKLFSALAKSEAIHRANHEKVVQELGGQVAPVQRQPVQVGTTEQNLRYPIEGEKKEESEMYPRFIDQAKKDHALDAVESFTYARDAEVQHEALLKEAVKDFNNPKKLDYYVHSKTGATVARAPKDGAPLPPQSTSTEVAEGKYLKNPSGS